MGLLLWEEEPLNRVPHHLWMLTGCKDTKNPPPDLKIPLSCPLSTQQVRPCQWSIAHQAPGLSLIQTLEISPDFSSPLKMFKARQPGLAKDAPAHAKGVG